MRRAVILGGTGAIGGATALTLASQGWQVEVTGRDAAAMPAALTAAGVRFHAVDRSNSSAVGGIIGGGADVLVDVVAYSAKDIQGLLPAMTSVGNTVVLSSRAVYIDADGRHINGDEAPRFPVPIREDNPTLPPAADDTDPFSRSGYAPSKVAVEQTALDSGLPVTIIRPSKVHGRWARNPRTASFVEAMLRGDRRIELARQGRSIDHLTAASNTAALIQTIADLPGRRVLNSADPDTPTASDIIQRIAERLAWDGTIERLDDAAAADRGAHPWDAAHPIVLGTSASLHLGYTPVGAGIGLLAEEIDWVAARH
ncbi:NAD-dependent epimerase/dehydratase family protein [Leifsonia sp. NPDC058248]|uniref:NAD-dependent epimerase/dehydratase family protein n=1 Tax=Leifsonia sp. NPDC058248 TaxID=3346402 RepID=UPI0036DB0B0E